MREEQFYEERLKTLKDFDLKELDRIIDYNIDKYEAEELKQWYIEFILEYDLDIRDGLYET